jgi:6-phosphofructokinase 1
MGRHSGYIALGTAYGQPDIILIPEHAVDIERLVDRVKSLRSTEKVSRLRRRIVDEEGNELWNRDRPIPGQRRLPVRPMHCAND